MSLWRICDVFVVQYWHKKGEVMKSYAVHNLKGGTGKTSTAGNLSWELSKKGKTILIDTDMQGNATTWFCAKKTIQYDLVDVLQEKVFVHEAVVAISDTLDILPVFAGSAIKDFAESTLFKQPLAFVQLREELEKLGYDYAVHDMAPSMSQLERCILISVDEALPVITPEYFSVDGVQLFIDELNALNKNWRKSIKIKNIVVNNINKTITQHRDVLELIKQKNYEIIEVYQTSKMREAQLNTLPLEQYDPQNKNLCQYSLLAAALLREVVYG